MIDLLGDAANVGVKSKFEYCNTDLAPDSLVARSCPFECTFCANCSDFVLNRICLNCKGGLVSRPRRARDKIKAVSTASTQRVVNSANVGDNCKQDDFNYSHENGEKIG